MMFVETESQAPIAAQAPAASEPTTNSNNNTSKPPQPKAAKTDDKKAKKARVSQAKEAWDLITGGRDKGLIQLFLNALDGEPYVTAKMKNGLTQTDRLDSPVLAQWLRSSYLDKTGTPIPNGLVADTIATADAVIRGENRRIPVFKRIGYMEVGGRISAL